ncbi:MAG: GNAT family N-acetyltransferase, partial [Armatimonadia bacterium]|nr:GNAT family N-acetyltransferase [Armatimonadia bacterium]
MGMRVREIDESDVGRVIEIFRAVYSDDFPFQQFYDARWVKKGVFSDDIIWLVAEDESGTVVGSASVLLGSGDADDLIGEFGRLVVDPDAQTRGAGTALTEGLVEHARPWIEWGFAECRTVHPGAQKILSRLGFGSVGFEPFAYTLGERRESMALVARLFGNATRLRRNNPRVIPEVYPIAWQALRNTGLEGDVVSDRAPGYPWDDELVVEELPALEIRPLLRLGRSQAWDREIYGGVRVEHGYLKLTKASARYLVARRDRVPVGAIGYVYDPIDDKVRVTELIATDDRARGTLVRALLQHVTDQHSPVYIHVDVSAYAPDMQATLQQMGFFAAGYCPAMVFEGVERLDIVRMVKLGASWNPGPMQLLDAPGEMMQLVEKAFAEANRGCTVADIARGVGLLEGLGDREIAQVRSICSERDYERDETVFSAGEPSRQLYVVIDGGVRVVAEDGCTELAEVPRGQVFGEMA